MNSTIVAQLMAANNVYSNHLDVLQNNNVRPV